MFEDMFSDVFTRSIWAHVSEDTFFDVFTQAIPGKSLINWQSEETIYWVRAGEVGYSIRPLVF